MDNKAATPRRGKPDLLAFVLAGIFGFGIYFLFLKSKAESSVWTFVTPIALSLIFWVVLSALRALLGFGPNAGNFSKRK
jgi:hypothetical protein